MNNFFTLKWPSVISLLTMQDVKELNLCTFTSQKISESVIAMIREKFDLLISLRGVKQFFLVRNQLQIHLALTQILLCGKTCNTSKGKSMAPGRKLEK